MCTVSTAWSADGHALRLLTSRDERRTRRIAWPPRALEAQGVRALWPVDPDGGGTWVAVTEAGLAFALLNTGPAGPPISSDRPSRGRIIPALAGAGDLDEVLARLSRLDAAGYAPFRIVAASRSRLAVTTWNGVALETSTRSAAGAHVFASSSLGDALVEPPRRALFDDMMARGGDAWDTQERFHVHAWPDRRALSVLMSRPDAATVSITRVVLGARHVELVYRPVIDGWPGPAQRLALDRVAERVAGVA